MPVAENRFLEIEPPADPAAAGMSALRKIFEEAASLSDWAPKAPAEQAAKAQITAEVAQLMGQLESAVLDVLLEDSSEALIRLKRRRQVSELQRAFGDPSDPDMTVRDFVEKCQQFEDELCKKYGVKSEKSA
ncbi:SETD4 [Symbiodinium natans]|uniref:SETD4 protein n=1 Tax=Symbiodinium natans TaxID=878477 RepID=A0A812LJA8_9DINO|nr:SETD4 [Symbiodinium natans]